MKICSKCQTEKDTTLFYKGRPECKDCSKKYAKENAKKIQARSSRWYQENKEIVAAKSKVRRDNNPEKQREYAIKNRERKAQYSHEYQLKNKDKIRKQRHEYYEQNKHEIMRKRKESAKTLETKRLYEKRKYNEDPLYRLSRLLRANFRDAVKSEYKKTSVADLLNCSIQEFRRHIESLWTEGMSWDNHGFSKPGEVRKWHIDHILPITSFDLTDYKQQKTCWRYTNLRPLWQEDNFAKSDRLPDGTRARDIKKKHS